MEYRNLFCVPFAQRPERPKGIACEVVGVSALWLGP